MTPWRGAVAWLVVVCGISVGAQAARATVALTVRVDGFADADGAAGIAVWSSAEGFPEGIEYAVAATYVEIENGAAEATFDQLEPGTYAVTVYHDRDDDKRFDKNWIGMPTEAWGVSNNVRPRLRAPTFDEARFDIEAADYMVHITVE